MNLDLKNDLTELVKNDIRFAEIELVRLSQDNTLEYKHRLERMGYQLELIAIANGKIAGVNQYFSVPQPTAPQQAPQSNGQTHVE